MELTRPADDFGVISFSPDERWFEFGPPGGRRRLGFHDYASIYAEPGLYERVFLEELGMRSTFEVVRLFGEALERLGVYPERQRVLDVGAGNGLGGELLRALGIGSVVAVELSRDAPPRLREDGFASVRAAWSEAELRSAMGGAGLGDLRGGRDRIIGHVQAYYAEARDTRRTGHSARWTPEEIPREAERLARRLRAGLPSLPS